MLLITPVQIATNNPHTYYTQVLARNVIVESVEVHYVPNADSQEWFWTEKWQQMEREADESIAARRVRSFDDVDSLLAGLDGP